VLRERLCEALSMPAGTTPEDLVADLCAEGAGDEAGLRAAAAALAAGSPTDRERAAVLAGWCEAPQQRRQILEDYVGVYLTDESEIRKSLTTKGAAAAAT
jgi:hypothetical protein